LVSQSELFKKTHNNSKYDQYHTTIWLNYLIPIEVQIGISKEHANVDL
jgi:hypothetical protein